MIDTINEDNLPKHIAIILDGNRRWAKENNLEAKEGHKEGLKNVERIVEFANKIGIKYLTVYAFSTENWKRTEEEVGALMFLFQTYLDNYSKKVDTQNIRFNVLGDITKFSEKMEKSIKRNMERTKNNTGLTFNVALNYGGRAEIIYAIKNIAKDLENGKIKINDINEQIISDNLYTKGQPDPDLLIRTSGEFRTSNFLPWQLVYSEFLFVDKHWPEFNEDDFIQAIKEYQKRNRRFGGK